MSPAPVRMATPIDGVIADVPERIEHLGHGLRPERVAYLLAVDGDAGDAGARMLVMDVLVVADGGPGDGHGGPQVAGDGMAVAAGIARKSWTRAKKRAGVSRCGA